MPNDGLDIVLTSVGHSFAELSSLTDAGLKAASETSQKLDDIEAQFAQLTGEATVVPSGPVPPVDRGTFDISGGRTWDEVRAEATDHLRSRGIDPAEVDIDELLDPAEVARIERRATGGLDLRVHLDRYDLLFAAAAGIAATVVDSLMVGIPRDVRWHGEWQQGGWLTGWLRDNAIESDNWLAGLAKVPFDAMTTDGRPIPGMSGRNHRVQAFGHDPLFGLLFGTLDIMRGTITGASPTAGVFVRQTDFIPVRNPLEALMLEILHLFSDLPTRAGLPVPGWSVLTTIQAGNIDGKRIDEMAQLMYVRGYDTWHFMSMATVPATVHLVMRAYWGMRRQLDVDYDDQVSLEAGPTGEQTSGHPRFDALMLAAHSVAAAGNIGKLIAYGGNPLALNYPQWLAFFRAVFKRLQDGGPSLTESLATHGFANAAALADGWVDLAALRTLPDLPLDR